MYAIVIALIACGIGQGSSSPDTAAGTPFEQELALAVAYDPNRPRADVDKNRDTAVAHYKAALALRPEDPDNMPIEYEVGILLSQVADPALGQKTHPLEAQPYLERAAHHYSYDDYYETASPATPVGAITRQSMMVHAAFLSGQFKKKPEEARQDYDLAMQYLNATIARRCQDLLSVPPPAEVDEEVLQGFPDMKRRYEQKRSRWEEARQAAESGEVFPEGSMDLILAETVVNSYRSSFGDDVPAESVPRLMEPILKKYPGTPMARFAQAIIDKAMQDDLIQGQTTK